MNARTSSTGPVAVIGAGPVGLAAAAHLVQRGLPVVIFEAGDGVAANLDSYRHVRLFSPWRYNVDRAARALLADAGWQAPEDDSLPTAGDLVDQYLAPLARTPRSHRMFTFGRASSRSRAPASTRSRTAGRERCAGSCCTCRRPGRARRARQRCDRRVRHLVAAQPARRARSSSARAKSRHESASPTACPTCWAADRARYAGRKVLVVGAGHSAAGNLLALAALAEQAPGTRIAWAVRGKDLRRLFGGGENDGLPARGELGTRLRELVGRGRLEVHHGFGIARDSAARQGPADRRRRRGAGAIDGIDEIVAATGARPDLALARELRLRFDPWLESTDALAPLIDPNVHSCGTVRPHGHRELAHPEPGFYAIGAKSYGRAPNFLMATGYEQARSVVAALAGDMRAADDVQLELPRDRRVLDRLRNR